MVQRLVHTDDGEHDWVASLCNLHQHVCRGLPVLLLLLGLRKGYDIIGRVPEAPKAFHGIIKAAVLTHQAGLALKYSRKASA